MYSDTSILEKLSTASQKRTFKKYRAEYRRLVKLLSGASSSQDANLNALSKAVQAALLVYDMKPYDVQLLGALILTSGGIAEINTGEGKTLIAAISACALALQGRRVHVYTPSDYLSQRDSDFAGRLASELGLSCRYVLDDHSDEVKREAFRADIVYTTEKGVIFSYIKDNNSGPDMDILPSCLDALIIDEADSILIDNGETPYILSGSSDSTDGRIGFLMPFAELLKVDLVDHKKYGDNVATQEGTHAVADVYTRNVVMTADGYRDLENYLIDRGIIASASDLYRGDNLHYVDALRLCLMAISTYHRDQHYVVRDGKVQVIDEHTGRILPSVRLNGGVHQALEFKEDVEVNPDSITKGKITLESFISKYRTISGMTGTAYEVKGELKEFFGLEVHVVPPNVASQRKDGRDLFFSTKEKKYCQMIADIRERSASGQPILVGASSVDEAHVISERLRSASINHVLLTPKSQDTEAEVIGQAGRPGRVTVTTNMAGRGTDIVLGYNPDALFHDDHTPEERLAILSMGESLRESARSAGGLHVIGTERSRSPRVDRQLMGRSGRQGDPGSTQFYISPDDLIFRAMAGNRGKLKLMFDEADSALVYNIFKATMARIQRDIQKVSLQSKTQERKYIGVHEQQMTMYYGMRDSIKYADGGYVMERANEIILSGCRQVVMLRRPSDGFDAAASDREDEDLYLFLNHVLYLEVGRHDILGKDDAHVAEAMHREIMTGLATLESAEGRFSAHDVLRDVLMSCLDEAWIENIARVESIGKTIHLRSYGGEKPDLKYQSEAFESYKMMIVDALVNVVSMSCATIRVAQEAGSEVA